MRVAPLAAAALILGACVDQRYSTDPAYAHAKDECSFQVRLAQASNPSFSDRVSGYPYLMADCMKAKGFSCNWIGC